MKKILCIGFMLVMGLSGGSSAFADIKVTDRQRGGSDLQNVHDRVLCVDGFKVFQTIVFGFTKEGGASVSNIQLMQEKSGSIVPVRCSN